MAQEAVDAKEANIAAVKRQRTRRLARLAARAYYLRRRGREQDMYNLVCNEFLSLGGVYIKFLQGVLFNSRMVQQWQSPDKLKIFENVDREPMDIIQILQTELTPEQLSQIALIQPEPFAAGSFGQVYLGQHVNGNRIIIKVLRPMVRELLKFDLRLLGLFSKRFAAREYENMTIKMDEAYREFRTATLSETDYVAEAHFARELFEAYHENPHFVVPETYLGLCTTHIIVQDYVGGISGAELLRLHEQGVDVVAYVKQQTGSDLDKQLRILGVECLAGAFSLPRIQGDPHPGNVRFMEGDKIGMIDFGISAPAPRNKAAFFGVLEQWDLLYNRDGDVGGLFEQFIRFFVNDLYRALKRLSSFMPQASHQPIPQPIAEADEPQVRSKQNDLMREIGRTVQNMFDSALGTSDVKAILDQGRVVHAFNQLVNRGNRLGLVIHLESSEILRAGQTYMSMVEAMGRRPQVIPYVLAESVLRVAHQHSDVVHMTDRPISVTKAIDTVNHWLERVAVRDPALFRQLLSRIDIRSVEVAAATSQNVPLTSEPPKEEPIHD